MTIQDEPADSSLSEAALTRYLQRLEYEREAGTASGRDPVVPPDGFTELIDRLTNLPGEPSDAGYDRGMDQMNAALAQRRRQLRRKPRFGVRLPKFRLWVAAGALGFGLSLSAGFASSTAPGRPGPDYLDSPYPTPVAPMPSPVPGQEMATPVPDQPAESERHSEQPREENTAERPAAVPPLQDGPVWSDPRGGENPAAPQERTRVPGSPTPGSTPQPGAPTPQAGPSQPAPVIPTPPGSSPAPEVTPTPAAPEAPAPQGPGASPTPWPSATPTPTPEGDSYELPAHNPPRPDPDTPTETPTPVPPEPTETPTPSEPRPPAETPTPTPACPTPINGDEWDQPKQEPDETGAGRDEPKPCDLKRPLIKGG